MRRIYYYGFFTRLFFSIIGAFAIFGSFYRFSLKFSFNVDELFPRFCLLVTGLAFLACVWRCGIFVDYKKNKLKISLPTDLTHVYTADEVHTVNIHKESNGYIFTVVFKNGKREEILNRTFARTHFIDSIQYDRLRDELGRFIVTANKEEEISDEEN